MYGTALIQSCEYACATYAVAACGPHVSCDTQFMGNLRVFYLTL